MKTPNILSRLIEVLAPESKGDPNSTLAMVSRAADMEGGAMLSMAAIPSVMNVNLSGMISGGTHVGNEASGLLSHNVPKEITAPKELTV